MEIKLYRADAKQEHCNKTKWEEIIPMSGENHLEAYFRLEEERQNREAERLAKYGEMEVQAIIEGWTHDKLIKNLGEEEKYVYSFQKKSGEDNWFEQFQIGKFKT